MRGWSVAVALVCATAMPAGALWGQLGGDAGHTGLADFPDDPWDIVARYDVLEDGWAINRVVGPGAVDTPHGVTLLARHEGDDRCRWVRITDPDTGAFESRDVPDAVGCHVAGASQRHGLVLMCRTDTAAKADLRAYDARTLEERWRITTADIGLFQGQPPQNTNAGCLMGALDEAEGLFVVPFGSSTSGFDYGTHRIVAVDLATGTVAWSTAVPLTAVGRTEVPGAPNPAGGLDGTSPNWVPLSTVLTTTGIAVVGLSLCPDAVSCDDPGDAESDFMPVRFVLAWLTPDGQARGAFWSEGDPRDGTDGYDGYAGGGMWATASRNLAFAMLGDELVAVDPLGFDLVARFALPDPQESPRAGLGHVGPLVIDGQLVLPLQDTVAAFDLASREPLWQWPGLGNGLVGQSPGVTTTAGQVILPSSGGRMEGGSPSLTVFETVRLAVLDGHGQGRLRQVFDVEPMRSAPATEPLLVQPAQPIVRYAPPAWSVATQQHVLHGSSLGDVIVLAQRPGALPVTASSLFPAAGEELAIVLQRADFPQAIAVAVNWDGEAQAPVPWTGNGPLTLTHGYAQEGRRQVVLTVRDRDDTTRTTVLAVDVGGLPPPDATERFPEPAVPDPYPEPGTPVEVVLQLPEGEVVEILVSWGDGATERTPWPSGPLSLNHTYASAGPKDATFVVVFSDGSTATRVVRFDVGGAPPPESGPLTVVRRALTAEDPGLAFLAVALLAVLLGVQAGLLLRRRKAAPIRAQLRELDDIRRAGRAAPAHAIHRVGRLRQAAEVDLLRGRLRPRDHETLERKAVQLLHQLIADLVAPAEGLSESFRRRFEAALVNGHLSPAQRAGLAAALRDEAGATAQQRRHLDRFLRT